MLLQAQSQRLNCEMAATYMTRCYLLKTQPRTPFKSSDPRARSNVLPRAASISRPSQAVHTSHHVRSIKQTPFSGHSTGSVCRRTLRCHAGGGFGALLKEKQAKKSACPCGGSEDALPYEECCKKYHDGDIAPDPVTLMKSRFSAYAKSKVKYIMETTHPDNPAVGGSKLPESGRVVSTFKQDVTATCKRVKFVKLEVQDSEMGNNGEGDSEGDNEAFVTFRAVVQVTGQKGFRGENFKKEILKERSRFLKSETTGKWLYIDGDVSYEEAETATSKTGAV